MADHPRSGGRPARRTARPARRRQVIRTDNTRSVLTVVAAEFLLPTGGAAWTSTFLEILGRFGIRPGTARQALARAAHPEQGLLRSEAVGRRKLWRLSSDGEQLLRETTARAFGFAQQPEEWDGSWLIVLASIPEDDRSSRYLLRSRLIWAGLGSPAPGVWVGTHTARQAEVDEALAAAGISDQARVFVASHRHLGQMTSMVADAWDLEAIARDYERFMEDFRARRTGEPLMQLVSLVVAWTRVVLRDPGLPRELLPATWPGAEAAAVFLDRHEHWRPGAMERWHEINDGGRPSARTATG
jgi:phenylacetic acid degradation operon negative regulatory protein